jgi:hypothetical protein
VRLEEEGVKIPETGAELRDDKLYPTIRALVDGGTCTRSSSTA